MPFFEYGETELEHLIKRDKKLAAAIENIGFIERSVNPDLFFSLCDSIIGQQISTAAARSIRGRVQEKLGEITPANVLALSFEELRSCGLSTRKVEYIQAAANAVNAGTLDLEGLKALPDNEIIEKLVALPGIGIWTAEMLMIFSLQRPNIVSYGDLAIRRGMMNLYGLKELPKDKFLRYCKRYSPYGSVASLYLWALA